MTPSVQGKQHDQKCKTCLANHRGPYKNEKYLKNKNFECGCDPKIDLHGYENHCCICKWGDVFHKMEWSKQMIGRLRCYICIINNRKIADLPVNQQPKNNNYYEKQRASELRSRKLTCKNIIYKGNNEYEECKRSSKGFNNVQIREYPKWNDETDQAELKNGPVCDKCIEHEKKYILQRQNA